MSSIRLTYTGVKYFILQILAYLIGIVFPIYVARIIPASEFGIYGFIASLWTTFDLFRNMISFWAGRMIARGGRYVKSSLISNLLLSIPLSILYLLILFFFVPGYENYILIYLLSVLYLPLSYGISGLNAYVSMKIPDKLGYGPLIFSLVKVSLGFILVYIAGLFGAIITLLTGYSLYFLYFIRLSYKEFEEKVDFTRVKEWIKGSWFVLLLSMAVILYNNITVLILGFLGRNVSLGSYYVAVRVSGWIGLTTGLSIALRPRLLSEVGGVKDVERTASLLLLFATPMLIGILMLDKGIVYLFGGNKYMAAIIPLVILAIAKYLDIFTNLGINTILGFEKFDKKFMIKVKELIKSDMFKILIYRYIALAILAIAIIILYPLMDIVGLALSTLVSSIAIFILISSISFRRIGTLYNIQKSFIKYLFSSLIMAIAIYLVPKYRGLLIISAIFIGAAIYFITLYIIDKDFRVLVKRGREELINILSSSSLQE